MSLSFVLLKMIAIDLREATVKYTAHYFAADEIYPTPYKQGKNNSTACSHSCVDFCVIFSLPWGKTLIQKYAADDFVFILCV